MRPVLFEVLGFPINSDGVTKALAALIAAYLLGREFRRLGWDPERSWNLVIATAPAPPVEDDLRQGRLRDHSESVHSPSATRSAQA